MFSQIQFPRAYCLTYVRFMQRVKSSNQFKDIALHFDSGTPIQVGLQTRVFICSSILVGIEESATLDHCMSAICCLVHVQTLIIWSREI